MPTPASGSLECTDITWEIDKPILQVISRISNNIDLKPAGWYDVIWLTSGSSRTSCIEGRNSKHHMTGWSFDFVVRKGLNNHKIMRNRSGTSNNIDYEAYELILMTSGGHWTTHGVRPMGGRNSECHPRRFDSPGNQPKSIAGANSRAKIYFDT